MVIECCEQHHGQGKVKGKAVVGGEDCDARVNQDEAVGEVIGEHSE
jgi:hypothetical protein